MIDDNTQSLLKKEFLCLKNYEVGAPDAVVVFSAIEVGVEGENKERIDLGISLATKKDVPLIYLGTRDQNQIFRDYICLHSPRIIIYCPIKDISSNTKNQVIDLEEFLKENNLYRLVFVSHLYHTPRIKRYCAKYLGDYNCDYCFVGSHGGQEQIINQEITKIIEYSQKGDFLLHEELFNSNEMVVLVSSASKKIPLIKSLRNTLNKLGLPYRLLTGDYDGEAISQYFSDDFWKMPTTTQDNYEEILAELKERKVTHIIPTRDGELSFWAMNKDQLKNEGISVMVSSAQSIDIINDKLKFYQFCNENNFPAIETSQSASDIQTEKYVVKEQFGAGSRTIGINLAKDEARTHAKGLESAIFQPLIRGKEYSVDAYVDGKGEIKGSVVRSRDYIVSGESQITTTVKNDKVSKVCGKLAEALKLYGHSVFQVLLDKDGEVHIIECNPRFGGASTLSVTAGLDTFYWFIKEGLGIQILNSNIHISKDTLRQVRHTEDSVTKL